MNGVQTRFKCKLDVKRCKRFVFPPSSLLPRSNALKTKAIRYFQTDRTLTRIVSPPLFIKLNESGANNVVASLQQLLADFQVYYTNLRGFHWNIKGHDFFVLHSQFEKMYDDTAEKVDEIAERILMLGGTPANKFSDYLKVANINEVDKVSNGEQALNNILQSISYLIGEERKILSIASQAGDEVTVSMMSDYLKEQEKMVWMLTAYNSK